MWTMEELTGNLLREICRETLIRANMWRLIRFCLLAEGSVCAHIQISCKYICFLGLRPGLFLLSLLWLFKAKKYNVNYRRRCTHAFINIFSCIDVNLEVSFINPTLPLAETNKTFAEDRRPQQLCGRKDIKKKKCVRVWVVYMWEVVIWTCVVFNVNICYLTKLKLASGNAYNLQW